MSRKIVAAALAAAGVLSAAPSASATAQIICWETRTIRTSDGDIQYRWPRLCG